MFLSQPEPVKATLHTPKLCQAHEYSQMLGYMHTGNPIAHAGRSLSVFTCHANYHPNKNEERKSDIFPWDLRNGGFEILGMGERCNGCLSLLLLCKGWFLVPAPSKIPEPTKKSGQVDRKNEETLLCLSNVSDACSGREDMTDECCRTSSQICRTRITEELSICRD
jgi:hypothetical protein